TVVAAVIPRTTVRKRYRVAKDIATSWVLSPISAMKMATVLTPRPIRKPDMQTPTVLVRAEGGGERPFDPVRFPPDRRSLPPLATGWSHTAATWRSCMASVCIRTTRLRRKGHYQGNIRAAIYCVD